jgi:CheY-like chemotaxis protein
MYCEKTLSADFTRTAPPLSSSFFRILLVDQHHTSTQLLVKAFRRQGHQVERSASVRYGLARLARGPYDLVIVDLKLLDGSGFDLLHQAASRGLLSRLSTVLLTSHDFSELGGGRRSALDPQSFVDTTVALVHRERAQALQVHLVLYSSVIADASGMLQDAPEVPASCSEGATIGFITRALSKELDDIADRTASEGVIDIGCLELTSAGSLVLNPAAVYIRSQ